VFFNVNAADETKRQEVIASIKAHTEGKSVRVGELDEEMVFESHSNETFILGASTWRIVEITHDRVLVVPAPGEPGKMPFWKGDGPGRPLEFGRRIGALVRELRALPLPAALTRLVAEHDLDPGAAENLMRFLADQETATGQVPDDRTIVIERCRDELGDWRVCVLTPFGSRIHIPWAMAVAIVDPSGNLVYYEKMDNTQIGSANVAIEKARSAALFKRPTKTYQDALAAGGDGMRILRLQGAVPIEGGIPILVEGKIAGAIGVSGGTAAQDGQCAKAGADALK